MTIHLNLGSNLGGREDILGRAVALIKDVLPGRVTCSQVIESAPWGFESANPFLNLGVMVEIDGAMAFEPMELLRIFQDIQHALDPSPHRDAAGGYIDRAIDIDIIAIDNLVIESPQLTLPHPRMHLRRFVLGPMAELAPSWHHPLLHLTPGEMMGRID